MSNPSPKLLFVTIMVIGMISSQQFKTELQIAELVNNIKESKPTALCTFRIVLGDADPSELAKFFDEEAQMALKKDIPLADAAAPAADVQKEGDAPVFDNGISALKENEVQKQNTDQVVTENQQQLVPTTNAGQDVANTQLNTQLAQVDQPSALLQAKEAVMQDNAQVYTMAVECFVPISDKYKRFLIKGKFTSAEKKLIVSYRATGVDEPDRKKYDYTMEAVHDQPLTISYMQDITVNEKNEIVDKLAEGEILVSNAAIFVAFAYLMTLLY